ncbi:Proline-rich receptor-like protein kinase [Actinidia chinensis var. chinensis]|uniref:Proline-rich receptor-like protein kinase n=1 Tax=Actinidia chinensis var. chinensis TaxID=1590841 RepID=A0A2R6RR91_ACTCC|nr:Proline-rich receptor-like protein kinase [Actinidia chinensis var. chinensis]
MNRSFRAQESRMPAVVNQRSSMVKEKEEELALFLEMRKHEKEQDDLFLQNSEDFGDPLGLKQNTSPIFNITSSTTARKTATDDFLNSDNDKNDYDWLLAPPGTPLFPSLEMESQRTVMNLIGSPKARPTALKSRLANTHPESASRNNLSSRQSASSPGLNTSTTGVRRPSSSGGPGSRPATPIGRPTLTSTSKPTLTTASKSTLTTPKPASNTVSRPSRSSTPTSRATLPSNKPTVPARSSTPLSRTTARSSSAPTSRPTLPASKTTSRAPTPTRRPAALSTVRNTSAPPIKSPSSAVTKPGPTTARNPVPPRASSPTMKPRPWKPSEMPGFSLNAPPNLRTTLPNRPISATRGRPGAPSARSSSVEPVSNGRVRRQSSSPSRGRLPNGIISSSGSSVPALSRLHAKANDNVSPVLIGTKMVERVINMRKLVPPKQDDKLSPRSNLSGKSSSPDSSGFGRSLSKKSLDMAIRHMDIRRTIPGNLRPLMTNIPASSMYSVRSGPTRGRTISVSDSPIATSSNASSEVSVNNKGLYVNGIEVDDDINSDKGFQSPVNIRGESQTN